MDSNCNCLGFSGQTIEKALEIFEVNSVEDLVGKINKSPICRTLSLSDNCRTIAESRYHNIARKRANQSYKRGGVLLVLRTPPFQVSFHNKGVPPGQAVIESYELLEPYSE